MSWPTVVTRPDDPEQLAARLHHMYTSVMPSSDANDYIVGHTMFGCHTEGERIGIAWDWIEWQGSVLIMTDPMTILSNLHFVDADGHPQAEHRRILHLNDLVANMPWQPAVKAASRLGEESRRSGSTL